LEIRESEIRKEEVLILEDSNFNPDNVCIVTGCGTGIGRATAVAASANKLMTVGLDINEKEGKKTQKMARDMGGQMIFIHADLCKDDDIQKATADAARLGRIKYLVNIAGI
jgi:3-hydroxybutyrate dehydrogenase